MTDTPEKARIEALDRRVSELRAARNPGPSQAAQKYTAASLAWRMVLELVVGMALGAGIGFGLDAVLGTQPFLLLLFALLGFAAGIRTMMRTADEVRHKRGEAARMGSAGSTAPAVPDDDEDDGTT